VLSFVLYKMRYTKIYLNFGFLIFAIFVSLFSGIVIALIPFQTGYVFVLLTFLLCLFIIYKNRYDLLLFIGIFIFAFAQFQKSIFELGRFFSLFFLCLLSAYLVRKIKIQKNPVSLGIGLLAFYSIISSPLSYHPTVALLKGVSLLLLGGFLLFVPLAIKRVHPQMDLKNYILRMYLWFSMVFVLSNMIYYFIRPFSTDDYFSGSSVLVGRFRGWFINPNDLATFLGVFFIPILWYEFTKRKMGLAKIGFFLVFLIALIELLATQSRAGTCAGIISLSILILGGKKWGFRIFLVVSVFVFLLTFYIENPSDNFIRHFIYRNEVKLEGSGRLDYWNAAWNRFLRKPVFGAGLGVSDTNTQTEGFVFSSRGYTLQKDNSYMTALEELGIIGTTILIVMLILPTIKKAWEEFKIIEPLRDTSNMVIVAIVSAGLFNACFESWLLSVGNLASLYFWIIVSMLMVKKEIL
jgi:O-antigen ligase